MKKTQIALLGLGAIFAHCASSLAQVTEPPGTHITQRQAPLDPGIVERPPARVDPKAIERPPSKVDPKIIERPPPPGTAASGAAAEPDPKSPKRAVPTAVSGGGRDLPSVIVLPDGHAADPKFGKGCWVQFYSGKSFSDRSVTLIGPGEMPKMNIPGGLWVSWGSVAVGPSATVTTFDYEQFKNRTAVFHPGQRIPDLNDENLGLFGDIHSLRITCGSRPTR